MEQIFEELKAVEKVQQLLGGRRSERYKKREEMLERLVDWLVRAGELRLGR